ncbi:ATP-dependent RNA helicase dbp6 [Ceratobasidium sp. 414]|nr:ATP-dependent RNA helicase dbp6 [Ceratobasidium sp. 414]
MDPKKTKSKARYLKAKKDRRKKRLKAASTSTNVSTRVRTVDSESESSLSGDEGEEATEAVELLGRRENDPRAEQEATKKRRSKPKSYTPLPKSDTDESMLGRAAPPSSTPRPHPVSPSNLPTLPSFPLPTQPAPPSKASLALQGLDRAILEAEIIDPASCAPVPRPGAPDSIGLGLDDQMRERLVELGVESLFAVQTVLLPFLLSTQALHCPYNPPRDACVSAPTGSGKTLAYIIPITQILSSRIVTRLRALVVLPTRDLVIQVRETLEAVAKGRGLKIAVATGQHSFAHEQSQLVHVLPSTAASAPQYHSKVDVLICTPGRLTDHLSGTPGFTLEHLRFLVIDEADRLITQSFQGWLNRVLDAAQPPPSDFPLTGTRYNCFEKHHAHEFCTTELDEPQLSSCQKLLFSATLTHDPSKIVPLGLRDPRYFVVGDRTGIGAEEETFAFPATLAEHMCVCPPAQKPLVLFHLVHTHGVQNALVFTKSAESTARLVQLFEFFEAARGGEETSVKPVVMRAYSSDLGGAEKKNVIDRFRQGRIDL